MKRPRFMVFGMLLAAGVTLAVSSLMAQAAPEEQAGERANRPRMMALEGRGAQIGVTVEDTSGGVRIGDVDPNSPGAKAGILRGDVVVEADGERVRSARQLARIIQETAEGSTLTLTLLRDSKRQTVTVTPESRLGFGFDADLLGRDIARRIEPELRELEPRLRELEPRLRELEPRLREFRFDGRFPFDMEVLPRVTSPRARLGVQLNELTPQLAEYFGAGDGGVLVTEVTKDSPAERAGLKAGDVITSIDGDHVRTPADLVDELRDKDGEVTVGILRDKRDASVKTTLESTTRRSGVRRPV